MNCLLCLFVFILRHNRLMRIFADIPFFFGNAPLVFVTDRTMSAVSRAAPANESNGAGSAPTINSEISDISVGNRPLHGTNPFVTAAMRRSRGESIIRHPVTPAALQPNPIHIVSACFPHAPDFLNLWSRLKATLGRYPESSSSVNSGKNIAIGGSMTATTHVSNYNDCRNN